MSDDFDALFDEISAQREETALAPAPVAAASAATVAPAVTEPPPKAEAGHEPAAPELDANGKPMFERLGGIVRMLHDSLRELGYDRSLSDVASQITDAQDRLEYIATLTEKAANTVLNAIDVGMPAQDVLAKQSKEMQSRWTEMFEGKLSVEEFKALAGDSRDFAAIVCRATDAEKARLLEIMMAQDFQDITGQLIKKIVVITSDAERELALLLRDNAPPEMKAAMAAAENKTVDLMTGPSVPSAAITQDGVDDLLESLGF
ncbi:MAG: protein phosphatase CheZ [Herminiimonas sp.]|nr:protein phosphatase CheZ [Herminiimonas sp.]